MGNKKKSKQLGMSYGTASGRLRKTILFTLLAMLDLNVCFQCGEVIEEERGLSIEHKIPWLDSKDPIKLFFNLNNIAFSHLSCNRAAARPHNKIKCPEGKSWCSICKQFKDIKYFPSQLKWKRGDYAYCTECGYERIKEQRLRLGRY